MGRRFHTQGLVLSESWTDGKLARVYGSNIRSIGTIRKRFVEEGFQAALERKKRLTPPVIKIDGEAEANIIALACSEAPEGRSRWTFRLLADKVVERGDTGQYLRYRYPKPVKKNRLFKQSDITTPLLRTPPEQFRIDESVS